MSALPFGDGLQVSGSCNPSNKFFTGKERDAESGLDYFGARYYGSNMGRWMSPDWSVKIEPVPYSKLDDPQSLNLYSYVRNNPLSGVDADGHSSSNDGGDALSNLNSIAHAITVAISNGMDAGLALQLGQQAQQQSEPQNADGSAKAPPTKDSKGNSLLPEGKNGKQNSWVQGDNGKGSRGKWKPEFPVPSTGGGQPSASWDDDQGHWDIKPGTGGKTGRYLPDGTPVDHWSNPITTRGVMGAAGAMGAGYLLYRGVRMLPSLAPPLWWTIPINAAVP